MPSAPISLDNIFGQRTRFPDERAATRLSKLVGLDDYQERLSKSLGILINPKEFEDWLNKYHAKAKNLAEIIRVRPPLVILVGDVGCGKTELAETIGHRVAKEHKISVTLYPLNLSTRGRGLVGEMTQLLTESFRVVREEGKKLTSQSGKSRGAILFLIDEADALAQSREAAQMHHEDKAGVNALIRGIDDIAKDKLPVAIIMCSNRPDSLDPAIKRRASDIFHFKRPDKEQRRAILQPHLSALGLSVQTIEAVISETGETKNRGYGFAYSDIMQRLLPEILLSAYPASSVQVEDALRVVRDMQPTPPFKEEEMR